MTDQSIEYEMYDRGGNAVREVVDLPGSVDDEVQRLMDMHGAKSCRPILLHLNKYSSANKLDPTDKKKVRQRALNWLKQHFLELAYTLLFAAAIAWSLARSSL